MGQLYLFYFILLILLFFYNDNIHRENFFKKQEKNNLYTFKIQVYKSLKIEVLKITKKT